MSDSSGQTVNNKLTALLAWAIKTQNASPTTYYKNYYGGYVQAVKDVLLMIEYDSSNGSVKNEE